MIPFERLRVFQEKADAEGVGRPSETLRLAVVTTTVVLEEGDDPEALLEPIGDAVCAHFGDGHGLHVSEVCPRTFSMTVATLDVGVE